MLLSSTLKFHALLNFILLIQVLFVNRFSKFLAGHFTTKFALNFVKNVLPPSKETINYLRKSILRSQTQEVIRNTTAQYILKTVIVSIIGMSVKVALFLFGLLVNMIYEQRVTSG